MRLVLCDDHRLFVEPMAAALTRLGHQVLVVTSPKQVVEAADAHRPDLCVIDLRFPDGDGIDGVRLLCARESACPVVVLSGSLDGRDIAAARAAGAAGFLRKDQSVSAIFEALERFAIGQPVAAPAVPRAWPRSAEAVRVRGLMAHLTERERQVLTHLVEADDTGSIASSMGVAPSTARTHLQNVLVKLGVHSRLQAVALVVHAGLDAEL